MDSKYIAAINIKNAIPITLEMESGQYTTWAELFRVHCRAHEVIKHLDPTKTPSPAPTSSSAAEKEKSATIIAEWNKLDAVVLQWIYSTISSDLLHTILKPNTTAAQAWIALEGIFQDNQSSRAVYLEHKFVTTRLSNFPNISAYCQALKMLSDQLANVGSPIANQRLVLQLIAGLSEAYEGIAMMIQQTNPLPDFYDVRSKLILEETRKQHQVTTNPSATDTTLHVDSPTQNPKSDYRGPSYRGGRGRGRGRGRYTNNFGRGRGSYSQPFNFGRPNQPLGWNTQPPNWGSQNWAYSPWAPPCPYPTAQLRPTFNQSQGTRQGILGPRPASSYASSYAASDVGYTPTEIDQAFNGMSLGQPDPNWYLDSGATSHMTHSSGPQDAETHPPMQ